MPGVRLLAYVYVQIIIAIDTRVKGSIAKELCSKQRDGLS